MFIHVYSTCIGLFQWPNLSLLTRSGLLAQRDWEHGLFWELVCSVPLRWMWEDLVSGSRSLIQSDVVDVVAIIHSDICVELLR